MNVYLLKRKGKFQETFLKRKVGKLSKHKLNCKNQTKEKNKVHQCIFVCNSLQLFTWIFLPTYLVDGHHIHKVDELNTC